MTHDELERTTVPLDSMIYMCGETRRPNLVEYWYVDHTRPPEEGDDESPAVCLSLLHPEHGRIMTLDGYTLSA